MALSLLPAIPETTLWGSAPAAPLHGVRLRETYCFWLNRSQQSQGLRFCLRGWGLGAKSAEEITNE